MNQLRQKRHARSRQRPRDERGVMVVIEGPCNTLLAKVEGGRMLKQHEGWHRRRDGITKSINSRNS